MVETCILVRWDAWYDGVGCDYCYVIPQWPHRLTSGEAVFLGGTATRYSVLLIVVSSLIRAYSSLIRDLRVYSSKACNCWHETGPSWSRPQLVKVLLRKPHLFIEAFLLLTHLGDHHV